MKVTVDRVVSFITRTPEPTITYFDPEAALLQFFLLLQSLLPTFLHKFCNPASLWPVRNRFRSTKSLKRLMETPFEGLLDWLIEHVRQEGHCGKAKLETYKHIKEHSERSNMDLHL